MRYDKPLRWFARAFVAEPPQQPGTRALSRFRELLGVDDLTVESAVSFDHVVGIATPATLITTPDKIWELTIAPDGYSLAFQALNASNRGAHVVERKEFFEKSAGLLAFATASSSASRVAAVVEGLLPQMDGPAMNAIAARLLNMPSGFSAPSEWTWRVVTSVPRAFGTDALRTNTVLTSLRRPILLADEAKTLLDRVRLDVDVNTDPSLVGLRLDAESVAAFLRASSEWHDGLLADWARLVDLEADSAA